MHWVGVAFLLIAAVLLLITTISAPVIGDIAILKGKSSQFAVIRERFIFPQ
jgi:hypothetical protein